MEAVEEEACDIGLGLGLGVGGYAPPLRRREVENEKRPPAVCLDLFFAIRPKEEEEETGDGDVEADGSSLKKMIDDEDCKNKTNVGRKKLRLSKEQSSLLENSYKLQTNLNPAQKQALAEQLNLKPRQIEVWFQNRRARTKLKQTEADCEYLKRYCNNLSEENRKLNKEVQELRSHIQLQKAAMCPSCEKLSHKSNIY